MILSSTVAFQLYNTTSKLIILPEKIVFHPRPVCVFAGGIKVARLDLGKVR